MKDNKILYIMHVPWAWIKQRPHFFAEYLNKDFDVNVIFKKPLKVSKSNLINKKNEEMSISSFFIFPFQRILFLKKLKFLNHINDLLIRIQFPVIGKNDTVWVTSYSMYSLVHKFLPSEVKLVYDCMDDELEFPHIKNNPLILKEAFLMEQKILKRANVVLCSSEYLKNKITKRTGLNRDITVVNNAIGIPGDYKELSGNSKLVFNTLSSIDNVFMYIGAISEWFDFDSILYVLEKEPLANIVLLGPTDIQIPIHERIHHLGTVKREDIFNLMQNVKGLIMPFKLNELIKSVNPVKLYEYVYMSKPIIATRYSETEPFEDYVYLYDGKDEFSDLIKGILEEKIVVKKNDSQNKEFALKNTWEVRYKSILPHLK
jgi:teichuronic acid biosynthesis glycosyltransferase TuaH